MTTAPLIEGLKRQTERYWGNRASSLQPTFS